MLIKKSAVFAFTVSVFISFSALAQEASPYVGGTNRAYDNEAIRAEADLLKPGSEPALKINPFPLEQNQPRNVEVQKEVMTPAKQVVRDLEMEKRDKPIVEVQVIERGENVVRNKHNNPEKTPNSILKNFPEISESKDFEKIEKATEHPRKIYMKPAQGHVKDTVAVKSRVTAPVSDYSAPVEVEETKVIETIAVEVQEAKVVKPAPVELEEDNFMVPKRETIHWQTPANITRWRALRGTELKELLALWSREGGMDFIWNTDRVFIVKETFSIRGSYQQAVLRVLQQYEGDVIRPFGHVYRDPENSEQVLVIRDTR